MHSYIKSPFTADFIGDMLLDYCWLMKVTGCYMAPWKVEVPSIRCSMVVKFEGMFFRWDS